MQRRRAAIALADDGRVDEASGMSNSLLPPALDANSRPLACSNLRAKFSSFEIHVECGRLRKSIRSIDLLHEIPIASRDSTRGLSLTAPGRVPMFRFFAERPLRAALLGDRLMVGQQVLALPMGVRVPLPQPNLFSRLISLVVASPEGGDDSRFCQ